MARPDYGPGHHLHFDDYPRQISTVLKEKVASESSLFEVGQTIRLRQTLNSKQVQGDYVVGQPLPDKRVIYTDTGEDENFNLKVSYYGWGEFYLVSDDADYFSYRMTKGMSIQAGDWSKEKNFETQYFVATEVPNSETMAKELNFTVDREIRHITYSPEIPDDSKNVNRDTGDGTIDSDGGIYVPSGDFSGLDKGRWSAQYYG